jgi:hypothetical protein
MMVGGAIRSDGLVKYVERGASYPLRVERCFSLSVVGATLVRPIVGTFTLDSGWCHFERFIRHRVASFDLPIPDQGSWGPLRHPPSLMALEGIGVPTL